MVRCTLSLSLCFARRTPNTTSLPLREQLLSFEVLIPFFVEGANPFLLEEVELSQLTNFMWPSSYLHLLEGVS